MRVPRLYFVFWKSKRILSGAVHGKLIQSFKFAHLAGGCMMYAIAPGMTLLNLVFLKR
jgi:hypothetical protein